LTSGVSWRFDEGERVCLVVRLHLRCGLWSTLCWWEPELAA